MLGSVDDMDIIKNLGIQRDYLYGPIDDSFGKKFDVYVGYGTTTTQNISLDRLVGKVEVNITDVIPANVTGFVLTINNVAKEFYFNSFMPLSNSQISFRNFDTSSNTIGRPFFLRSDGNPYFTSVKIDAYGENGTIILSKIVENVELAINKKTVLTGKLFDANQGFTMSVNSDWGTQINVGF